jgi:hypothetical protein
MLATVVLGQGDPQPPNYGGADPFCKDVPSNYVWVSKLKAQIAWKGFQKGAWDPLGAWRVMDSLGQARSLQAGNPLGHALSAGTLRVMPFALGRLIPFGQEASQASG